MTQLNQPFIANITNPAAYCEMIAVLGLGFVRITDEKHLTDLGRERWEVRRLTWSEILRPSDLLAQKELNNPFLLLNYGEVNAIACLSATAPQQVLFSTRPSFILRIGDDWVTYWVLKTPVSEGSAGEASFAAFAEGLTYAGEHIPTFQPEMTPIAGLNGVEFHAGGGCYEIWELMAQAGISMSLPPVRTSVAQQPVRRSSEKLTHRTSRVPFEAAVRSILNRQLTRFDMVEREKELRLNMLDTLVATVGFALIEEKVVRYKIEMAAASAIIFQYLQHRLPALSYSELCTWLLQGSGPLFENAAHAKKVKEEEGQANAA